MTLTNGVFQETDVGRLCVEWPHGLRGSVMLQVGEKLFRITAVRNATTISMRELWWIECWLYRFREWLLETDYLTPAARELIRHIP